MRTLFIGIPLLALAAVVESTVLPDVRALSGGTLNLVLILVLSWTLAGDWSGGLVWGFIGGVLLDLLSGGPFGKSALALVLVAYVASWSEGQFWRSHILLPLAAALLGTLVYHVIVFFVLIVGGTRMDWLGALTGVLLPALLVNTLIIVPVFWLLRAVHEAVYPAAVRA
jgi:rod shape-determining protein MreD